MRTSRRKPPNPPFAAGRSRRSRSPGPVPDAPRQPLRILPRPPPARALHRIDHLLKAGIALVPGLARLLRPVTRLLSPVMTNKPDKRYLAKPGKAFGAATARGAESSGAATGIAGTFHCVGRHGGHRGLRHHFARR